MNTRSGETLPSNIESVDVGNGLATWRDSYNENFITHGMGIVNDRKYKFIALNNGKEERILYTRFANAKDFRMHKISQFTDNLLSSHDVTEADLKAKLEAAIHSRNSQSVAETAATIIQNFQS